MLLSQSCQAQLGMTKCMRNRTISLDDYAGEHIEVARQVGTGLFMIRIDHLNFDDYMKALRQAYNPAAAENVMCRSTLSVSWDGQLFDCDFNQMLGLNVNSGAPTRIEDFDFEQLRCREIVIRDHCFACTAGAGSSCQGVLEEG